MVTEAADLFSGPLFPSGSDVSEVSCALKIKLWILQSFLFQSFDGLNRKQLYLCKNHWKHHRFQWIFIETEVSKAISPIGACRSPLLHHCRAGKSRAPLKALRLISQASISKAICHFNPSVRRLETAVCPRNRLWTRVCCVCGVSCGRCSVLVRGKVFVSPSPGPSVCCVSVECVRCCGSSTGRKPDPGPVRRGPHLKRLIHHIGEVTLGSPTQRIGL